MTTLAPLALIRFMTPWIEDWRKLSELDFMVRRYTPTTISFCFVSFSMEKWNGGRYGFMIDGVLFTGEEVAQMSGAYEGWTLQYRFADPADMPLGAGEYLMPVRIDDRLLVEEMSELLNLFSSDGKFISDHDKKNFGILFEKTVLKKLKLYHESNPRGYGRLAAMHLIQRLRWGEDTGLQEELIRQIVRR